MKRSMKYIIWAARHPIYAACWILSSVKLTKREVIEKSLLTALDDKTKVAILLNEQDLRMLIAAMQQYSGGPQKEFAADMIQLLNAAFPLNEKGQR